MTQETPKSCGTDQYGSVWISVTHLESLPTFSIRSSGKSSPSADFWSLGIYSKQNPHLMSPGFIGFIQTHPASGDDSKTFQDIPRSFHMDFSIVFAHQLHSTAHHITSYHIISHHRTMDVIYFPTFFFHIFFPPKKRSDLQMDVQLQVSRLQRLTTTIPVWFALSSEIR